MNNWTGVGPRDVALAHGTLQIQIGEHMAGMGCHLYSGGARGSDFNFTAGQMRGGGGVCIIRPYGMRTYKSPVYGYPFTKEVFATEEMLSVAMHFMLENKIVKLDELKDRCTRQLLLRNFYQVADTEAKPVTDILIHSAKEDYFGNIRGGTRTAVYTAREIGTPTYNLTRPDQRNELFERIGFERKM